MSMTREATRFHSAYEEASPEFQAVIDAAYTAARRIFESAKWPVSNNDAAEEFVAAIVKYAVVSKDEAREDAKPAPWHDPRFPD